MNLYLSLGRIWSGTQADAKEAQGGKDFVPVEVSTDKPSLLAFLNELPTKFPGMFQGQTQVVIEDGGFAVHPGELVVQTASATPPSTEPYMKSRDPAARGTCLTCGRSERHQKLRLVAAIQADIAEVRNPEDLAAIIEAATAQKTRMESD